MKSPSDTTIYRPALMKGMNEIINKISNFVEQIRIGSSKEVTLADSRGKEEARDDR